MNIHRLVVAGLAATALLAGPGAAFAAKTLVYCSEGSPEGFNPQFFTTGTTADASSVPIYNRLVEFEIGTTNIVPGLAESWTAAPDGMLEVPTSGSVIIGGVDATGADAASVPIYNRLVEFEIGTTNIVPGLAESWTAAPDGLSYTFKLRHGVKFHSNAKFTPTRDFNADDVLFSYNRMADPNHPFAKVTPGQTYAYFEDMCSFSAPTRWAATSSRA